MIAFAATVVLGLGLGLFASGGQREIECDVIELNHVWAIDVDKVNDRTIKYERFKRWLFWRLHATGTHRLERDGVGWRLTVVIHGRPCVVRARVAQETATWWDREQVDRENHPKVDRRKFAALRLR
jgi:hypothetical protein